MENDFLKVDLYNPKNPSPMEVDLNLYDAGFWDLQFPPVLRSHHS